MKKFEFLITDSLHKEMLNLRDKLEKEGLSPAKAPQIAVMPKNMLAPRVLFVGKAPGLVPSDRILSMAYKEITGSLRWHMTKDNKTTPFWRWCRYFISEVEKAINDRGPNTTLSIVPGWSNLAKIGGQSVTPPSSASLKRQAELSQKLLRYELSHSQADATIFLTGSNSFRQMIQDPIVGDESSWKLDNSNEWVAQKSHEEFGLLFWINHPQGQPNAMRDFVAEWIVPQIIDRWQKRVGE